MLLSDWRVLLRRWYLVVVGLLATAGLCYAATVVVPVQYEVTSNVLMLPPKTTTPEGQISNPYLGLGGLEGIADVVCKTLTDRAMAESLTSSGIDAKYTMIRDPASAAPVILMSIRTTSAREALSAQQFLLDRIPQALAAVQQASNVRSGALITSAVITEDKAAAMIRKSQIRALVVATVGGLGMTFLAVALIDGMLMSRPRRPTAPRNGSSPGTTERTPLEAATVERGATPRAITHETRQ